ncbi:unnamed protein product [Rotaria socialis]|uniref:Uncharacterized protein n=1 Tax=Rotaria socialis TaxID=392032 RepID=A0A818CC17_9BILA|nr:unnamed protein product [Rotaria socialis]CAF3430209.1 unnamed protein product [Rotaria socialis]CAF3504077.1 unnamed protein product [Rotaria socialis]
MDPTPKRRGRPRKSNVLPNTETIKPNVEKTKKTKPNDEPSVPKIENLLAMNAMVVQQRKAAKVKKKYKEASSEEEYVDEQVDEESDQYEEEEEEDENVARPNRRSSAAKRKSLAIQSKDQTESWGNYRNTIDNGPVPRIYSYIIINYSLFFIQCFVYIEHPLTLNETTFDVALKLQRRNQDRQLAIDYLDNENEIELIKDSKMTEQVLTDTYHIQLSQNVCRTKSISSYSIIMRVYKKIICKLAIIHYVKDIV